MNKEKFSRKGITPIVSIVLILLIVIILIVLAFLFFSKIFEVSSKGSQQQTEAMAKQLQAKFVIDTVDTDNDIVYLRNIGPVNVTNLSAYVNKQPTDITYPALVVNSVAPVAFAQPFPEGKTHVKITTSQGFFYVEQDIDVPGRWVVNITGVSGSG